MLNYFFGSRTLINEKTLERNNIAVINFKDIKVNKNQIIALTASGKFYNGTFRNDAVSVKVVDISKDESIINEFIYWQEFKSKDCFLKFYGASISGTEAYLVFEFFAFTLENALKNKILKNDNLPKIAKQILNILEIIQKQKKMIKDLRPGVLGISEGFKIKLLDFGFLISDKPNNLELIEKERNKYRAYESFIFLTEELPYDIWSFGCILIDLFSKKEPIYKLNLSEDEIRKMHDIEAFPLISDEISGFLREIILKCLERVPDKRITIEELKESLTIFLQNMLNERNDSAHKNKDSNSEIKNSFLRDNMDFYCETEKKFRKMTNRINNDLNENNILMKNNVEAIHDECITKISDHYTQIKQILSETVTYKIEASDKIDEGIREKILMFQEKTAVLVSEICENTNIINEMKSSIVNLNSVSNPESYTKLIECIKANRKKLEDFIRGYSEESDFDMIDNIYKDTVDLIEDYRELSDNYELLLMDILDVLKRHNERFYKTSNVKKISKRLNITLQMQDHIKDDESESLDFYAKVQEDSNLLIIYNFKSKRFSQMNMDIIFPAKSNSYFINSTLDSKKEFFNFSIYVTGGSKKNDAYHSDLISGDLKIDQLKNFKFISLKDLFEIKIQYNILDNKYTFKIEKLQDMNHGRYSHSTILFRDFLLVISGQTTKSCELYSIKTDAWKSLPDIPTICSNACLSIVDNNLYCISGSSSVNSFDVIYKLALNNIEKFATDCKGFEDFLAWEQIEYYFSSKNFNLRKSVPRLRRGMAGLYLGGDSLFLFGGFDNDNIYDDIYEVYIKKPDKDKNQIKHKSSKINNQIINTDNSKLNDASNGKATSNSLPTNNNNFGIFEKSEKEIEENIINERNNNGIDHDYQNSSSDNNEEDNLSLDKIDELDGIKIEKKLTILPNKTFFPSNILVLNNTILMIDGYNNAIEYDINNNHFFYYT